MKSTILGEDPFGAIDEHQDRWLIGLVLIWSLEEPWRVGEMIALDDVAARTPRIFGRSDSTNAVLCPARLRPEGVLPQPPFKASQISRKQLTLLPTGKGAIKMASVGIAQVLVNGAPVKGCILSPGDCLELKSQLLFIVVSRLAPVALGPMPRELTGHSFGECDGQGMVGESAAAWSLRGEIAFAARGSAHTLILGESGAGKEGTAKGIHRLSARGGSPLVSRNMATIPEGLMESELFGNVENYPQSGMKARLGLIGEANASSLFLDEIGELPESLQAQLLRVMDSGEYHRLGEDRGSRADLRIIAATNRTQEALKHDILARLRIRVTVPSLNQRREDIPLIIRHLLKNQLRSELPELKKFFPAHLEGEPFLSPALVLALTKAPLPGNVRDLQTHLYESIRSSTRNFLTPGPLLSQKLSNKKPINRTTGPSSNPRSIAAVKESLKRTKSIRDTAKDLGLTYRQVVHTLERHGLNLKKVLSE